MTKTDKKNQKKINLSLNESLFPILLLIIFLSFNVYVYGDDAMGGSNQFILLLGAAAGIGLGIFKGFKFSNMMSQVAENLKSVTFIELIFNLEIMSSNCISLEISISIWSILSKKAWLKSSISSVCLFFK